MSMSSTSSAVDEDWFPEARQAITDHFEEMMQAASKQYCSEVVSFYKKAFQEYAAEYDSKKRAVIGEEIARRFLDPDSMEGINLTGMERRKMELLKTDSGEMWPLDLFDDLKYNVLLLVHTTVLPAFKETSTGLRFVLTQARQSFKRFLGAGGPIGGDQKSAANVGGPGRGQLLRAMGSSGLQVRQRLQQSMLHIIEILRERFALADLIGTHKSGLRRVENCLVSRELVALLVSSEVCTDTADAVELGQQMVYCAVIHHADEDGKAEFLNDDELWQFSSIERFPTEQNKRSVAMLRVNLEIILEGKLLMKKRIMSRAEEVFGLIAGDNVFYLFQNRNSFAPFAQIDVPSCSSNIKEWHDKKSFGFKLNSSLTSQEYTFVLPEKSHQVKWMDALYRAGAKFMHGNALDSSVQVVESLGHVDESDVRGLVTTRVCPFSRRVLVFRKELHLPQLKLIMPSDVAPDGDLKAFAPGGRVPILLFKSGEMIEESLTIMRWFGAVTPLWCSSDSSRARMDQLYSIADHKLWPYVPTFCMARDEKKKKRAAKALVDISNSVEPYLDDDQADSVWAVENRFTVADLSLPILLRRAAERGFSTEGMVPRVKRWIHAVWDREVVQEMFS